MVAAALVLLITGGCSDKDGDARPPAGGAAGATVSEAAAGDAARALAEIDAAMAQVGLDAEKYVPGPLDNAIRELESLKAALARNDTQAVLDAAPGLLARVRALPAETAAARQSALKRDPAAMQAEWRELSVGLPPTLSAIEARIDALSRAGQLPVGMTAEGLARARSGVAEAREFLKRATAANSAGNVTEAVALAGRAESKVDEALTLIGMR
jgi:hypothetical protein